MIGTPGAVGGVPFMYRKISAATPSPDQTYAEHLRLLAQCIQTTADGNGLVNTFNLGFNTVIGMAGSNSGDARPCAIVQVPGHPRQPVFYYSTGAPLTGTPTKWPSGQTYGGSDGSYDGWAQFYLQSVPVPLGFDANNAISASSPSFPTFYGAAKIVEGSSSGLENGGSDNSLSVWDQTTDEIWDMWKFGAFNLNRNVNNCSTWGKNIGKTSGDTPAGVTSSIVVAGTGLTQGLADQQVFQVGGTTFKANGAAAINATTVSVVSQTTTVDLPTSSNITVPPYPPVGYVPPFGDGWYYVCGNAAYCGSQVGTPLSQIGLNAFLPNMPNGLAQGAGATNWIREAGGITPDDIMGGVIRHAMRLFINCGGPYWGTFAQTGSGNVGKTSSSLSGTVTSIPISGGTNFPLLKGQYVTCGGVIFQVAATTKISITPLPVNSVTLGGTIASGTNVLLTGVVGVTSADMPPGTITSVPCAGGSATTAALWAGASIKAGGVTFTVATNSPAGSTAIPVTSQTTVVDVPSGSPIIATCTVASVAKGDSTGFPFGRSTIRTANIQLSSTLSTGAAITSLPVSALTQAQADVVRNTAAINLSNAGHSQICTCTADASLNDAAIAVQSFTPNFAYPGLTAGVVQPSVYTYQVPEGSVFRLRPDYVIPAVGSLYSAHAELVGATKNPTVVIEEFDVWFWTCWRDYGIYVTDQGTTLEAYARHVNFLDTPYGKTRLVDFNAKVSQMGPTKTLITNGVVCSNNGTTGSKNPFANGPWLNYTDGMPVVQLVEFGSW